jgi:hypothetical protein
MGVGVGKGVDEVEVVSNTLTTQMRRWTLGNGYAPVYCVEIWTSNVGSAQKEVDSEGNVLLGDAAVASRGILRFENVGSGLLDVEGVCVRLVRTGRNEGMVVEGGNEDSWSDMADDDEGAISTVRQREAVCCLGTRDIRAHSISSQELPVLAG